MSVISTRTQKQVQHVLDQFTGADAFVLLTVTDGKARSTAFADTQERFAMLGALLRHFMQEGFLRPSMLELAHALSLLCLLEQNKEKI